MFYDSCRDYEYDKAVDRRDRMKELKPCPFCGGKAELNSGCIAFYAECVKCKASTKPYDRYSDVIAAWNNRITDTVPDKEIEYYKNAIRIMHNVIHVVGNKEDK